MNNHAVANNPQAQPHIMPEGIGGGGAGGTGSDNL